MKLCVLVVICTVICCCSALNILVVFPHPGASHFFVFDPLFKELAHRGHNVTVISYLPQKKPVPNLRDIPLNENFSHFQEMMDFNLLTGSRSMLWFGANLLGYFASVTCEAGLTNQNFQNFLKEDHQFDLILMEYFNTNCFNGLLEKYKAPVIGLSSCVNMPWFNEYFAIPENPAYVPTIFMDYSDKLTFIERVENTVMKLYTDYMFQFPIKTRGNELSKKYTSYNLDYDHYTNSSLLLVNTFFSLNLPRALPPNVIEIGGMHVPQKTKPLPKVINIL